MSNGCVSINTDAEKILQFICSDPRYYLSAQVRNPHETLSDYRDILVDVDNKTFVVGSFEIKPNEWRLTYECGGPAPWRDFQCVPCPIGLSYVEGGKTCPVCGGVGKHLKLGSHHPIFEFLEKPK